MQIFHTVVARQGQFYTCICNYIYLNDVTDVTSMTEKQGILNPPLCADARLKMDI